MKVLLWTHKEDHLYKWDSWKRNTGGPISEVLLYVIQTDM